MRSAAQRTAARKAAPRAAAAKGTVLAAAAPADGEVDGAETDAEPVGEETEAGEDAGLVGVAEVAGVLAVVDATMLVAFEVVADTDTDTDTDVVVLTLEAEEPGGVDEPETVLLLVLQLAGPPPWTVKTPEFWLAPVLSRTTNRRLEPTGSVTNQLMELFVSSGKARTVEWSLDCSIDTK